MDAKLNFLRHLYKIRFAIFLSITSAFWLKNLEKGLYDPKNIFTMDTKMQNLMPISNPLKKWQKSLHEESKRAENFCICTVLKGEKVPNFYTFMLIAFFVWIFLYFFQGIVKNSAANTVYHAWAPWDVWNNLNTGCWSHWGHTRPNEIYERVKNCTFFVEVRM